MNNYTSKDKDVKTECSMFNKKTPKQIMQDIKFMYETLDKINLMPQEIFNSLSDREKHYALWLTKNYPRLLKIEDEPT